MGLSGKNTFPGTDLTTLVNDSMADLLHRHSELSASDGSPNAVIAVDAAGATTIAGIVTQGSVVQTFSGTKTLADNSVTGFVEIACIAGQAVGGTVHYTLYIDDSTNLQCHAGELAFAAVNKAGTITADIEEQYLQAAEAEAVSSGTLTDDFSIADGTNKVVLSCDADTSLNVTITIKYTVTLHSTNVITAL